MQGAALGTRRRIVRRTVRRVLSVAAVTMGATAAIWSQAPVVAPSTTCILAPQVEAAAHGSDALAYQSLHGLSVIFAGCFHDPAGWGRWERGHANMWPLTQAVAAALLMAGSDKGAAHRNDVALLRHLLGAMEPNWNSHTNHPGYEARPIPPLAQGSALFSDDSGWAGLDLLGARRYVNSPVLLSRAEDLFAFIWSEWDRNPSDRHPGGVFWSARPNDHDRNTVSTALGALLGMRLYLITHNPTYLRCGTAMLEWVENDMKNSAGLFDDTMEPNGRHLGGATPYVTGLMMGANIARWQALHDKKYLRRAEQIAKASFKYWPDAKALGGQHWIYDSIYVHYLAVLDHYAPHPRYRRVITSYAAWLRNQVKRKGVVLRATPPAVITLDAIAQAQTISSAPRVALQLP